jgi:ELWxxDGT repeat protein
VFRYLVVLILTLAPVSSIAVTAELDDVQSIARLYSAAFDRVPKIDGLNFWVDSYESGRSIVDIAKDFYQSPEFTSKYGDLSDRQYVERLFINVLGRPGSLAGIDFWTDHLANGVSRARVLVQFADSPENIAKMTEIFDDMRLVGGQWLFGIGTKPLTELVKDMVPGSKSGEPWNLIDFKDALYLTANADGMRALWRSDGTPEGTGVFKQFAPDQWGGDPGAFVVAGDQLFFRGTDYEHGTELWVSDGTVEGTVLTRDIWWGGSRGLFSFPMPFKEGVLFIADDGVAGPQFWTSDGTEMGTRLFKDDAVSYEAKARNFWAFENGWLFKSEDPAQGPELWSTDGREGASKLVKDIVPGPEGAFSYGPFSLAQINGLGIFWVWKENSSELWLTDGTESGTRPFWVLSDPGVNAHYRLYAYKNTVLFFLENGPQDWELWRSDGTEEGTRLLKGGFIDEPSDYIEYNGLFYFALMAADRETGVELWRTDGTIVGTRIAFDLYPGQGSSYPGEFTLYAGLLYFTANDGMTGEELYRTDGTAEGTELVADIAPGPDSSSPNQLTVSQGAIFFDAWEPLRGRELYKSTTVP